MRSPNAQNPEPQTLYLEIRDLQPKTDIIKAEMGARTLAKAERENRIQPSLESAGLEGFWPHLLSTSESRHVMADVWAVRTADNDLDDGEVDGDGQHHPHEPEALTRNSIHQAAPSAFWSTGSGHEMHVGGRGGGGLGVYSRSLEM